MGSPYNPIAMKLNKLLVLLSLFVVLTGCGFSGAQDQTETSAYPPQPDYASPQNSVVAYDEGFGGERSVVTESMDATTAGGYVENVDQKIIKTGNLSLHVEDVRAAVDQIKAKMTELEGNIDSSSVTRYEDSYTGYLTLRVPSDQFETTMMALKELALYTDSEDTNAENITEVYMDTQARLENYQAEEQQYQDILDKAVTIDEILQVTNALADVRYQIESLESTIKYYDSNVSYSTINVTLTEDASVSAVNETWRPLSTIREAFSGWFVFLQDVIDAGIYLVVFLWPIALILVGWLWLRKGKKSRK